MQVVSSEEDSMFACSLKLKKPVKKGKNSSMTSNSGSIKLPKMEVPAFNGDIL